MGGASLIKSATLRTVVSEAQNYKVSANAFYSKYNFYPGDFNKQLYAFAPTGNGDGIISNGSNLGVAGTGVIESALAISHLYKDNSLDSSLFTGNIYNPIETATDLATGISPSATEDQNKAPRGKMSGSIWVLGNDATLAPRNVVFFTGKFIPDAAPGDDSGRKLNNILSGGVLNYVDSLAIDSMVDDGNLISGFVQERTGVSGAEDNCRPGTDEAKCSLSFDLEFFSRSE